MTATLRRGDYIRMFARPGYTMGTVFAVSSSGAFSACMEGRGGRIESYASTTVVDIVCRDNLAIGGGHA
jgi:hypothetical protein